MSPIMVKPDEVSGSKGSGTLARSGLSPVLRSPRGSLFVIWKPSALAYFCPGDLALIQPRSSVPCFPGSIHELGRKSFLLSLLPVSSAASWGSAQAIPQACPPHAHPAPHPPSPILGPFGSVAVLHPRARRQQLSGSSGFTEVVLIPSSMT